jgi:hypothetical protein
MPFELRRFAVVGLAAVVLSACGSDTTDTRPGGESGSAVGGEGGSAGGDADVGGGGGGQQPLPLDASEEGGASGTGGTTGGNGCGSLQALCGSDCVLLSNDPKHCGACDHACATGQVCSAGNCLCKIDAGTPDAAVLCGVACVDTSADIANCGTCGNVCTAPLSCVAGVCACPGGGALCGGACVDTKNDGVNCGACGTICSAQDQCTTGQCCASMVSPSGGGADAGAGADAGGDGGTPASYTLEFGDVFFQVSPYGGRIATFQRRYADDAGSPNNILGIGRTDDMNGATFWPSPQSWPWPPQAPIDSALYPWVSTTPTSITMTSNPTTTDPKVQVTKVFTADLCRRALRIDYTMHNTGSSDFSVAPWQVARFVAGGLIFFRGYVSVTQMTYTGSGQYVWHDAAVPQQGKKLKADGYGGWVAATDGHNLFVLKWADVPTAQQAPGEGEVELYDGVADATHPTGYTEIEVQGPYTRLAAGDAQPGNSLTWSITWYIVPMPAGASGAVGNQGLLDAVQAIVGAL